jgi:hypothetical protein
MNKYQRLLEISKALYDKNKAGRAKHFSFILNKSKLLAIGLNNYEKSHPIIKDFNYHPFAFIHAELAACLKLGMTDCSGLTIVNVRVNGNGAIDNSCFCKGCASLIRSLNFKKAFFTNKKGNFERFILT